MAQRRESRLSGLRTGGNRLSDFSVAETLTPEERYVAQNPNDNQFFKGLRTASANISTGALRNEQLDAELSGDAEAEDIARRGAERIERDRGVYAPRVNSLRDINNVGDAGDFVASSFGQGLGSMAPSVAAALATRGLVKSPLATFASASAASYPQVKGEAVSEQYNDPILAAASAEDRSTMATRVGLAGSALEALVPTSLSRTLLRGPAGEGIRGAARTAGRNIITEGTTETAQTEAQFLGARALDPTRERDPMAYADAFAAGAITGGGTSAGASAIRPALGAARDVAGAVARPIADGLGRLSSRTGPTRPNDPAPVDVSGQPPEADLAPAPAPVPAKDSAFYEAKSEDLADEIMAGDTDPGLAGATREETAANMAASEERRVLGAQRLRNELMARTDVPDTLKTQMREYGSVTDPAVQKRIADVYRKVNALRDLENVLPDENATVADFTEIKDGGVKRRNLQNMQASKMPQLVNTLARVLGPQADQAPKIARQLTALAARLDQGSLDADTVETMTRTRDALGELDTTGVIQEVLAASLPALAKGMEAIQAIPSALSDVRGSEGQSFLESMMPRRMPRSVTNTVARFVDDNATGYPNMEGGRRERVLDTMTQAFGSPERAEIVMDYYGELRRQSAKDEADRAMNDGEEAIATQDVPNITTIGGPATEGTPEERFDSDYARMLIDPGNEGGFTDSTEYGDMESDSDTLDVEAENQGIQQTTEDILNRPEYVFQKGDEPFRAFEGSELSNKRVQSIASAEASKRRGTEVADTQTITMNQYVEETGGSLESEYQKISKRLDDRISSLAGRSKLSKIDRDRLNERRGERALIDKLYEEGGAARVLEQYQVIKVQNASPDDSRASDVELGSMRTMLDREPNIKELTRRLNTALRENKISQREMDKQLGEAVERRDKIRQTRITFEMADGTATPLSAESMWKTVAAKSESRQNEREDVRLRRLFHEAVALVLNRPDVVGIKKTTESKVRRSENPNSPPNTAPEQIIREMPRVRLQVDGELFNRAVPNPSYRAQVREGLTAAKFSMSQLKTKLDDLVDQYWAADEKAAPTEKSEDTFDSRKEEIKGVLDDAVDKNQRVLDDAMLEGKRRSAGFEENMSAAEKSAEAKRKEKAQAANPLIGNVPAQAVARERLRLFRDARQAIKEADDVQTVLEADRKEPIAGEQDPDTAPVNQSDPKAPKDLNKQGRDRYETGNHLFEQDPRKNQRTRKEVQDEINKVEKSLERTEDPAKRQSILDTHTDLINELYSIPRQAEPVGQPASGLSRARVKPGAMDVESGLDVLRAVRGNRPVRTQEPYLQRIVVNKGYRQIAPGLWAPPEDSGTTIKPAMRMLGDKSLEALYNVAVEGNLARLDSASKKAAFDAMADVAKEMIEAIPAADRTGKQAELLSALNKTARQVSSGGKRIVRNTFLGEAADPEGARKAIEALNAGIEAGMVWNQHGWFNGPDGKMRREFDDASIADALKAVLKRTNSPDARALEESLYSTGELTDPNVDQLVATGVIPLIVILDGIGSQELANVFGYTLGSASDKDASNSIDEFGAVIISPFREDANSETMENAGSFNSSTKILQVNPAASALTEIPDSVMEKIISNVSTANPSPSGRKFALFMEGEGSLTQIEAVELIAKMATEAGYKISPYKLFVDAVTSTFLHEFQHAIQAAEGFDGGGNPLSGLILRYTDYTIDDMLSDDANMSSMQAEAFSNARSALGPDADIEKLAFEAYQDLVGEIEARDVEARRNMTGGERRAALPQLMTREDFVRSPISINNQARANEFVRSFKRSSMNPRRGRPKNWSQDEKQEIIEEIRRIRGEDVRVSFETFAEIGASGEFSMDEDHQNRLIRLAVNAGDVKSVAWHESLHDFFHNMGTSPEARKLKASLLASSNRPAIKTKLRELLAGHPSALKQIEGRSPEAAEERLAYMYQFWADPEIALDIDTVGVNIFQRLAQLIRELIGTVSADQKVAMVMAALHEGALTNPNIVAEVMAERGQTMEEKMEQHLPFLRKSRDVVLGGATDRLRDTGLPALIEIADALHQEAEFEDSQLPFLQRRFMREGQWSNKMEKIFDGSTTAQRKTAIKNMQGMREPTSKIERELAAFFKDIRKYMIDSGVMNKNKEGAWVPMGEIKNYFPRVFDRSAILDDREGFRQLLIRDNVQSREADAIIRALTSGDGRLELAENEHHLGFTPFAASVQNRQLTFIKENNAADYAKYQSQDLADILTGYVKQAVHRAEYAVDFGNDGKWISDKLAEAGRQGATAEELKSANKQVQALEGTLGHDMNPRMKEYMSLAMTYQNVVLLPLAIFSQMVDSLGLGVRTGSLKEAGTGYTRALKDLKAFVTRDKSYDYDRELAEMLGVISKDNMLEAMGQTYGSMYMSRGARNVNRAFFKYNGMQGWNNSMRIAATVAGERYLLQHTADSRRMEELGVKPVDIKPGPDGRLAITPDQFVERGMTRARAEQSAERVQQALFKFVDGAVIRPNAAHRAVWMSDPRFMLIAHLKQFAFSFQSVILRRATYESENDNIKPMLMLGMYVPVMFAADMAKWTLTGSVPPDWTFYDHFMHSVTRSGLLGKGEFYNEAFGDAARGNLPGQSFVLGPTGEHAADLMNFAAGDPRTDTEDVVDRSIPFARYFE
jgi:hypothetical protein